MTRSAVLRMFVPVALVAAVPLLMASGHAQSAAEQVFRAHSDLVVLHVNVFRGRSDAVANLPREAFTIIEDGKPQQLSFFNNADVPVSVGLVIDNSGSMIARHKLVVEGSLAFANGSHPEDELFTVVFNEHIRFGLPPAVPFTKTPGMVHATLSRFPAGGRTALHDAVVAAIDHLENATHQKRVLIVLSDGEDNASRLTRDEMLDKAARSNTIIYTVSHARVGRTGGDGDRRVLRKLADTSGGTAFFPSTDQEAVGAFEAIAGNIRRGYALGYVPTNSSHDGGFRRVLVRVRAPGHTNLRVRARDGYLASDHSGTR
jgi:Ca-activated chloride channel homolog